MGLLHAPTPSHGEESEPILIEIQVSPSTLNIASGGEVVTVHTDIAYSIVEGASVTLNDIEISWWKMDDRGYFVAKFTMDEVKALAGNLKEPVEIDLTLAGIAKVGEESIEFSGSETITVINVQPVGRK
jgi:hypothetical protein